MIDRARHRLLWALGASALLHVWLAHTGDAPGTQHRAAAGTAPLIATLSAMPNAPLQNFEAREAYAHHAPQSEQKAIAAAAPRRAAPTAASAPDHPVAQAPSAGADKNMAAPASDPTYYTARSLDVYPRALTALHLGLRAGAGQVRATLLIDESGTVNDVRAIEAGAADIENAARDLLLRTRFTPAGKDGRLVKSQLLVSLDYDAR